jgi:hypothetical protein
MAHDRKPRSWLRPVAIAFALFAAYVALGVLTSRTATRIRRSSFRCSQNEEAGPKPRAQQKTRRPWGIGGFFRALFAEHLT